jgi:hypothetical protein
MVAASSFETLAPIYQTAQRHVSEDRKLEAHLRENFFVSRSFNLVSVF